MYFFTPVIQNFLTKPWRVPPPIYDSFLYQFFLKYRCVPLRVFSALWDYLFSTENWDILPRALSIHNFFHYQKISEKQKGSFLKFSGHEGQKRFDEALHTPLLFMEKLYIRIYSKYRCVPLRFLSTLWKKIKGEKWYPLLIHKFFYTGKVLKYTRDPLGLFSVLWDKKSSMKMWTPSPPLTYYAQIFSIPGFFWIRGRLHLINYGPVRQNILDRKSCNCPFMHKNVGAPNLLIHWRFPHEIFWHCETINSDKTVMPSYSAWKFLVPRTFSKHGRVPLRIFWSLWNKNKSTENRDVVPPSSPSNTFFHTKKLLKRRRDPKWSLSVLWDKKFPEKSVILPPIHQIFLYQIIFWKQKGSPINFLGVMRHKKFSRELWCHHPPPAPSSAWQFSTPEVFWNTDVFPYEIYR